MVTCSVIDCCTTQRNNPEKCSFHRFPTNLDTRNAWLKLIDRLNWIPKKNSCLCSKHFEEKYFQTRGAKRILMKSSIPSKFVPLSFIKCAKCGTTKETNPELSFYKFPFQDLEGKSVSADKYRAWAEYCWPDKVLTPEELTNVYKEKQVLCSKHFPDNETAKRLGLQLGVPADFPTGEKKNHIVRTHGYKDAIDEVFEDKTDVSMYEETVVKIEPCDSLLHEGYKCDVCLSSISGYRYTCVQCADVDLCGACEASGAHAAHYVLRVPRPRPEEEVQELLKELRDILKKRPPSDPSAEKMIIRVPAAEDPLLARAPPDVPRADQSESDDETTESESEDENVPELRIADSPAPSTSRVEFNPKGNQTSRRKDQIPPKRRKLNLYQEATPTTSEIGDILNVKCSNSNKSNKTPVKEVSRGKVNILKEKLRSKLEATLTSETVQETEVETEAQMEVEIDESIKLEIDDEDDLGKDDVELSENDGLDIIKFEIDEQDDLGKDVELGENDGLSDVNEARSRRELDSEHLQETLDEKPVDFIMQQEHFSEDDPLASVVPAKASPKTKNVQIVTVKRR